MFRCYSGARILTNMKIYTPNYVVPNTFLLRADKNTDKPPNNGFILCLLYKERIKISNSHDMEKCFHRELALTSKTDGGIKSCKKLNMQVTYSVTL